jgi:flagellar hook-associated protein 1 FlgK
VSLNDILTAATSGLAASQAGMSVVSDNIANVSTPGYARQKAVVSTSTSAGRTTGVMVGEPERIADRFLESTVYRRTGDAGQAEVTSKYLDQLQSLLGTPQGNGDLTNDSPPLGLPAELDDLMAKAIELTGGLEPGRNSNGFVNSAKTVLNGFRQFNSDIDVLRTSVASEVASTVDRVNGLLKQIDGLNDVLAQSQALGRTTSGAADERMSALQELSGLIDVTIQDQPDGRVTIGTGSGQALIDGRLRQLSYPESAVGAQSSYPAIEIRFAGDQGSPGAATGQTLEGGGVGGTLGGLLQLRDKTLTDYQNRVGIAYDGLAQALNAAANEGTTIPAPPSLTGRPSGLQGDDRAGFTGAATFAVTSANGTVIARADVDFDALPASATVQDVLDQINTGLGGAATATLAADGTLSFAATGAGNGVLVAQDPDTPSSRAGVGFSQFFGLNDMVRSDDSPLVPPGFDAGDETGFGAGETAQILLRDPNGRALANYTLTAVAGQTFGDVIDELNSSPLAGFGSFALRDTGEIGFTPSQAASGVSLSIPVDSTDRKGTGLSFSQLTSLDGQANGIATAHVRADVDAAPANLPLGRFQFAAGVGDNGLGVGDTSGATGFIDALNAPLALGTDGRTSITDYTAALFGGIGADANLAATQTADTGARRDDAIKRRDTFSGVNVDEELANMVVLQNSYSAAARVLTTASDMYDTLINMVK